MLIRRFRPEDAAETSAMIAHTLRTVNINDYTPEFIEETVAALSPEVLVKRNEEGHFYVLTEEGAIIGCGGIAGYWGSLTESILLSVFIAPECEGKGYGRQLIETLEQDEIFLRSERIEIAASVTALGFYQKLGYGFKNGDPTPDDEGHIRLEKFRSVS